MERLHATDLCEVYALQLTMDLQSCGKMTELITD